VTSAYKAIWVGVGAPLHHEAGTAEDIIAWGDQIWGANMGVVWIMAPGLPTMSLVDFKKQRALGRDARPDGPIG
jgi:hypothetical protein